ncbi:MAG: hypothetical protein JWN44_485 [Myxococcales bacterium]|nr:hypothetical protein [Myxococcales bacterium]
MEPKDPKNDGGEVVSLDDARKKAEEAKADVAQEKVLFEHNVDKTFEKTINLEGGEFLKPVMAAIARELAGVADPDGTIRVGGTDEASRAKTAAVVKGLGVGLGQALAEAFGKWAQKIETGQVKGPDVEGTLSTTTPPSTDDPDKKPS